MIEEVRVERRGIGLRWFTCSVVEFSRVFFSVAGFVFRNFRKCFRCVKNVFGAFFCDQTHRKHAQSSINILVAFLVVSLSCQRGIATIKYEVVSTHDSPTSVWRSSVTNGYLWFVGC